jgi:hypothetical protein
MRVVVSAVLLVACTKASPSMTRTAVVTDAAEDARLGAAVLASGAHGSAQVAQEAAPSPGACAEPSRIVPLGTVNEVALFEGDVLVGETHAYDPETLAPRPKPKPPDEPRKPGRYAEVAGGVGILRGEQWPTITLEDTATRKVLRVVETCAAAGGPEPSLSLSATGRFLICRASRTGDYVFETHPNRDGDPVLSRGPNDVSLSPSDRYAISVPVRRWLTGEPTGTEVMYFDIDARTSKPIARAEVKPPANRWDLDSNPFGVSFCGVGELFAMSLDREIAVYRGADGARLASAPATKGRRTSFDGAGRYVSQTHGDPETGWATTVFRLVP